MAELFIGIEGGGTKSHVIAADGDLTVLAESRGEGTNCYSSGWDRAVSSVMSLVSSVLEPIGGGIGGVTALCLSTAGCNSPEDALEWERRLKQGGFRRTLVYNDTIAALVGALHKTRGITLISGTGSNCFGCDGAGRTAQSGGWDYIIGDEGSSYFAAREMLNAVARAEDKMAEDTLLCELLLKRTGALNPRGLSVAVGNMKDKSELAALAVLLDEACAAGDKAALRIAERGGHFLAEFVLSVYDKLGLSGGDIELVTTGGMINNNQYVRRACLSRIAESNPHIRAAETLSGAAYGAVLLASGRVGM